MNISNQKTKHSSTVWNLKTSLCLAVTFSPIAWHPELYNTFIFSSLEPMVHRFHNPYQLSLIS